MSVPPFDLDRFKRAQDAHGSFVVAIAELRAGRKTSHWIWWVFPQLAGLGSSATTMRYALSGRDEARAYLADDVLRARLVEAVTAVHGWAVGPTAIPLDRLMGAEVDALKLVSSMTLFAEVMKDADPCDPGVSEATEMAVEILEAARAQGYPACAATLAVLRQGRRASGVAHSDPG